VANNNDRGSWPYRFDMVPLDRLFIDADYQRPLTSFVDQVERDYNPALLGTLVVSERKTRAGNLQSGAIIDGQTRWEAMRRKEESKAPCLIYEGLTREQEAELFADLQTKRRGMATYLRFRASLVAKRTEAIAIAAIVQNAGFELDVVETPRTVKSIAALEWTYRKDPQLLANVMDVIARAWPDPSTENRTTGDLIRGLAIFLAREHRVDRDRLVSRLGAVDPRMIRHRANALMEGGGGSGSRPGYMADAILGIYMRGARSRASNGGKD
jgi:uncharacterized protein DUF6551